MVISDFYGIDLHLNDGTGHFTDATARLLPEPHAFGMAHSVADFDLDGSLDILMIGMNSDAAARLDLLGLNRPEFPAFGAMRRELTRGNRLYSRAGGVFRDRAVELNIARAGWAWGAVSFDADDDFDPDVFIVNGHNSRATAMDYESQFWRHDIHVGNSESNAAAEKFFQAFASKLYGAGWSYGGFHKNKFFLNQNGTNFLEVGYLQGLAMEEDCRNLASADLDADGDLDLILTTFQQWPRMRQSVHAFRNERSSSNWAGVALDPAAAPGAIVTVQSPATRAMIQTYVTGDSYRSQRPAVLRFALASNAQFQASIHWPNTKFAISLPLTNRTIHLAAPPSR
jgi:hypothetical protein